MVKYGSDAAGVLLSVGDVELFLNNVDFVLWVLEDQTYAFLKCIHSLLDGSYHSVRWHKFFCCI